MPILLNGDEYIPERWCLVLNVFAIVMGLWTMFPISVVPFWIAMFLPVAALLMVKRFKGAVTLDDARSSPDPSVATAFALPMIALAVRGVLAWNILDWQNFWLPFALITLVANGLTLWLARHALRKVSVIISGFILLAAYGFGVTVNLNGILDTSQPVVFHATVLGKHTTSGRYTSYYLTLSPWGPRAVSRDVDVRNDVYNKYTSGNTVTIDEHKGFFGIPYFFVR